MVTIRKSPIIIIQTGVVEGDYSSYAVYDSFDDSEIGGFAGNAAWVNGDETNAILVACWTNDYIKVYNIASKTLGSSFTGSLSDLINADTLGWIFKQSLANKYVAFIDKTTKNLKIYKDCVLLQTLTPTDLGFDSNGARTISFSPKGKYIFLTGVLSATSNNGWVILKGS